MLKLRFILSSFAPASKTLNKLNFLLWVKCLLLIVAFLCIYSYGLTTDVHIQLVVDNFEITSFAKLLLFSLECGHEMRSGNSQSN